MFYSSAFTSGPCCAVLQRAFPATPRRVRHRPFKLQQRLRFFADVQSATKCSLLMWPASVFQTNHGREQRHWYRLHLAAKRILRGGPDICICVLYWQLLSSKQMHACTFICACAYAYIASGATVLPVYSRWPTSGAAPTIPPLDSGTHLFSLVLSS